MKHIVIFFLLATFTLFSQSKIDRDLGDFSKVAVYDGINLELIKSEENKVEITGKNTNFVVVKNKNGDLKIRLNLERRFSGDKTKVTLYYKTLYNIISHEGSNVFSKDIFKQADLNLKANTGSTMNIMVSLNTLNTASATGSTVNLSGNAEYHDCSTSTGAEIKAEKLKTNETYATSTTGGLIELSATKELEANTKLGGVINVHEKTDKIVESISLGGVVNYIYNE
ncbi:MAG: hypothetical protein CMC36_01715 [Flavobacteriaceae bacterium]|nr:hypothetical protein [Flavobacteriaceae bacterium]|tara:strand:- start:1566 stop:2243 length:678 start_codon:yes stop_codon:yes gene_type:complete